MKNKTTRRLTDRSKHSVKIVETKTGIIGKVLYEPLVKGKVRVYTDDVNYLCEPESLILKGFID